MVKKGGILTPNPIFFQSVTPNLLAWLLFSALDFHGPLFGFCYTKKCGGFFLFCGVFEGGVLFFLSMRSNMI